MANNKKAKLFQPLKPHDLTYVLLSGRVRRNHQQLIPIPENSLTLQSPRNNTSTDTTSTGVTRTSPVRTRYQTGTRIMLPDRLTY